MTQTMKQTNVHSGKGFKASWSRFVGQLGRVGKALLFPIAMMPIAAILLRIGAQIPTDTHFASFIQSVVIAGGNVVFDNLPMLFAIGLGFGLAKDNRGEAAISSFVGMLLLTMLIRSNTMNDHGGVAIGGADLINKVYGSMNFHGLFGDKYDAIFANNVLVGITAGSIVAFIYNKFNGTELPAVLGFFSGRRLIPVMTILSIMIFGVMFALVWPWVAYGIYEFSNALSSAADLSQTDIGHRFSNAAIMGVYGLINRLLIPFGLHHIPNTLFWFQMGSHPDDFGNMVNGDINIFLQGTALGNPAGIFQSGFFPIMMFGLPALVAVFYVMADSKEQKMRVLGMFGSAALVSFISGITEPIEFAFLFAAPALFIMHACLTGVFGFIVGLFGIQIGFGFSAGLLDYIMSIPKSMDIIHANKTGIDAVMANPAWIMPIGAAAASTYFFLGKFITKKFNLDTPGRGKNQIAAQMESTTPTTSVKGELSPKAQAIVAAYGGYENITNFQNCATRLRYDVVDASKVDKDALKAAGIIGVMVVSPSHVQAIVGPKVEILNNEIIAASVNPKYAGLGTKKTKIVSA